MATQNCWPNGDIPDTGLDEYLKLIEEPADDDLTNIYNDAAYADFLYTADWSAVPVGATINSITLKSRCRTGAGVDTLAASKALLSISSTSYYGTEHDDGADNYNNYTDTWATNPATSAAWVYADLASLNLGVALRGGWDASEGVSSYARCTQLYAVVDYTAAAPGGMVHRRVCIY